MKRYILLGAVILASTWSVAYADYIGDVPPDLCSNVAGLQDVVPANYHANGDGTCTMIDQGVTIDIVPPGGEPQAIDVAKPGEEAKTIDVNPVGGSSGSGSGRSESSNSIGSGVTPKVITSTEELQTYVFSATTTPEERVTILQTRLITLLQALVQMLTAQLATAQN